MSSEPKIIHPQECIIRADNVGKCYKIYDSPKARLKQALWRSKKQYYREFWALKNISFEVNRGESLGIIGRNGSGKSTLLQIICGTLTPTEGNLNTKGRIAPLLELGSGFNPEFTGLENIYLNATLLGLSKEKTEEELESILAFADIGEFIHQPVKTYSSGMTVRLAFAVIAHVHADILIVDEALAVGDAIFVQRCMRYIRKMREERCLLFVSHDSEAVMSLCSQSLWLSDGEVKSYGDCQSVSLDYLRYCTGEASSEEVILTEIGKTEENITTNDAVKACSDAKIDDFFDYESTVETIDNLSNAKGWKTGAADLILVKLQTVSSSSEPATLLKGGEEVEVVIKAKANQNIKSPIIGFVLKDRLGQSLFGENTHFANNSPSGIEAISGDEITATFRLLFPMLPTGEYTLMASVADGDLKTQTQHHWTENAILIRVISSRVRYGLVGAFISHAKIEISSHQNMQSESMTQGEQK